MSIQLIDIPQGEPEWLEFRKGKITATQSWRLLEGESPQSIIQDSYTEDAFTGNEFTERGKILEDEARKIFQELNPELSVAQIGAIINDRFPNCSCSPDFLIDEDGGGEIKSFNPDRMEDVWKNLDPHIISQIQFNLMLSERRYWVLILFNPDLGPEQAYKTRTFYPDPEIFQKFQDALNNTSNQDLTQDVSQIINLEQQIQAFETRLGDELTQYQNQKQQLEILKQNLKDSTTGKISKTIELNGDKLSLSIYDTHRVVCTDPQNIPKDYLMEEEITEPCFARDDKIYRYVPNTKLAQNLLRAGKSLPEGFTDKPSRNIRIKFNGKTI